MNNTLTYETWNGKRAEEIISRLKDSMDVLRWAYGEYGDDIVYACSFGVEGIVLLDLISHVRPGADIVFLDTGLHFQETYELIRKAKNRWPNLNMTSVQPEWTVTEQARVYGDQLWKRNPNLCCQMRKTEPLRRALKGKEAWISGIRREQSPLRRHVKYVNKDEKFQLVKVCPLVYWTWEDVWTYVDLYDLPYNDLHDQGYPSIGCAPCTLPVGETDDFRAGRWAGFAKTECGLHQ